MFHSRTHFQLEVLTCRHHFLSHMPQRYWKMLVLQGTCYPADNEQGYECQCRDEYQGNDCGEIVDPCATMPCTNKGTCYVTYNGFKCRCLHGFQGKQCIMHQIVWCPVGGWATLGIQMRHFYSPGILTWQYRVILTLGNSDIEFCKKQNGVDAGKLLKLIIVILRHFSERESSVSAHSQID